jgi:predicted amidohydrolase
MRYYPERCGFHQLSWRNMEFTVAGLQMPVTLNVDKNVDHICAGIDKAVTGEADILLTPEGSLSGYTHNFDPVRVEQGLSYVISYAKERSIGLALGVCYYETNGYCYNQIRFYKPDGVFLGYHAKILRCGTLTTPTTGEINHFQTKDLRTFQWNPELVIGGLICNDLWANPECTPMPDSHLAQQLSDKGAKIIFHSVNGGRNGSEWSKVAWQYHNANLRMRARAAKTWIVTVDSSYPAVNRCSSPSGIVSPEGTWLIRSHPFAEQFFTYCLSI